MNATENKQLAALGFCGFTVPAILLLPQTGWLWALFAALAAVLVQNGKAAPLTKPLCIALLAWNLLLLGKFARLLCFPQEKEILGLLLLLLSAHAASKKAVPRVAAVLVFFLAAIYVALMGFALPDIKWTQLAPKQKIDWTLLPLALVPCLLLYIRKEGTCTSRIFPIAAIVLAVLAAIVTQGMKADDFYTAAKSVNILGTMERLEPLVSAALTAGGFCLLGLICCVNQKLLQELLGEWNFAPVNFSGGLVGFFLVPLLPSALIALGTSTFWGLLPILAQGMVKLKKIKKIEKSA